MVGRIRSASTVGPAKVYGYRRLFHKVGRDGTGKADLWETGRSTDVVWGVVYEIAGKDQAQLDQIEDFGLGYNRIRINAWMNGLEHMAFTYRAILIQPDLEPADWYAELVRKGAEAHGILHLADPLR